MSLQTKLKFVLVLDPDEAVDERSNATGDTQDDICEAMFDLQEVIDGTHFIINCEFSLSKSLRKKKLICHSFPVYDIDMEPQATLEIEVDFSDNLWHYFEELTAAQHSAHNE